MIGLCCNRPSSLSPGKISLGAMSLLSWYLRDMCSIERQRELRYLFRERTVGILLCMERIRLEKSNGIKKDWDTECEIKTNGEDID